MPITLSREEERLLRAVAEREGMGPEAYLHRLIVMEAVRAGVWNWGNQPRKAVAKVLLCDTCGTPLHRTEGNWGFCSRCARETHGHPPKTGR